MLRRSKRKTFQGGIPWAKLNFERQKLEDKSVAKCSLCQKVLKNTGYKRLKAHKDICKQSVNLTNEQGRQKENTRNINNGLNGQEETRSLTNNQDVLENVEEENIIRKEKSGMRSKHHVENLEPLTDNISSTDKSGKSFNMLKEDEDLAKFFFGCNIPFSIVEADYFLQFTKTLCPDYVPPTRKTLSSSILDKMYRKVLSEHSFKPNEKCVLLLDGWKNSIKNEKYVVGIIHNANGERYFLNSWDFTEKSETALTLKEVVEEACIDAKEKYGVDIYSVVSDNVSTMISMGKMIDLWHLTCDSHSGNLLAKDLVESSFTGKVVLVLKEFKTPELERKLVQRGGKRICLPADTRWCSYRNSYRCYLENLAHMRDIILEGTHNLNAEAAGLVLYEDFEEELVNFIIIFDGICELVNKCQRADFNIADSLEKWLKLQFPLCNDVYDSILEKRLKKVIKPVSLAANILHPSYKGKAFVEDATYNEMANRFLMENLSETGLKDLTAYQKDEGIFLKLKQKNVQSPETFWTLAEGRHPELSKLAKLLLRIPSSTAALERLFSQWSFVHSKLRNRLTTENSKKLIHLYYTLNISGVRYDDE